ncbi:phosphatase PAP2 family protein [Methylobacterium sp. J-090]|uniref:phosphatase PAP2 family protein n=1 Tax=Methylobacterium sp. J-090 TaxID=2836666 RepID=UPI001FB88EBC|nr:phosphatase PAP2 family protein [Methylobacterium sp. J-090]MCJ2081496.1 phosphatase PAP2 family protein [Methylobacterium sp. J-090]
MRDHDIPDRTRDSHRLPGETADIGLAVGLGAARDHPAIRAVGALSEVGAWEVLFAGSAAIWAAGAVRGDSRMAAAGRHMLGAGLLASVVKTTLKRLVHRTRPNVLMETGLYARGWLGPNDGPWQSFPSGHAAVSVAVARAVARTRPRARHIAHAAAGGVVAAQVLRGAHYPADVIAGALIGLAAEAAVNRLVGAVPQAAGPDVASTPIGV